MKLVAAKNKARREGWIQYVRTEQDERALLEGCTFDASKGERIVEFCAKFLRHYEGEFAGKPFELIEWQRQEFVMPLFSWLRIDGTRRFREASVWIAKKNGKTALMSAMAIVGLVGDQEPGAKVFSAAVKRDQAAYIYDNAEKMVKASPDLKRVIECIHSQKRLVHHASNSIYHALSAEGAANEGLNASMLIQDELHAWSSGPGRKLHGSLKYAGSSRRQPLKIDISTAGDDVESLGYERYGYAKKVRDCVVENTELLPVIYEAGPEDDISTEETWRKANPSLGVTLPLETFRSDYKKAMEAGGSEENDFRRYRLNQWVSAYTQWIRPEDWARCNLGTNPDDLLGKPCCMGLDLALVDDVTAAVCVFPLADEMMALVPHFFLPEDGIVDKERRDEVHYRSWQDQGYFTLTPGSVTDFEYVKYHIREQCERYDVREVAYDPYSAHVLAQELAEEGLPMVEFRQGFLTMSEPCKQFQRLVKMAKIEHFGNPVLRWMAGNAVTRSDPAGNIKLDKAQSRKKIDGVVGAVMGFGRARLMPDGDYAGGVFVLDGD